ncbi:hypothetical protein Q666_15140 [Marinobacter sp. ES-1]|nr:hypothetical protein Q666_15140 [Marinobacter sp. ES-1]
MRAFLQSLKTQALFHWIECGFEDNAGTVGTINFVRAVPAPFAREVIDAIRSPVAVTQRSDSVAA